jgi:hypothetical protein
MNDHVTDWLPAYHDGELHGRRLKLVQFHLEDCEICRTELEKLQSLGALLQASPPTADLTPPDRFAAQVVMRMPRRPKQPAWQKALRTGWQLTPLSLIGIGAFLHTAFIISGVVLAALQWSLGGDLLPSLFPPVQGPSGLEILLGLADPGLEDLGNIVRYVLGDGGWRSWELLLRFGLPLGIGLLYCSWLASWWIQQQGHQPNNKLMNDR